MKVPVLKGINRDRLGKNFSRKSRREGNIPAVVYGNPNKHINLDGPQALAVLSKHGDNAIVKLNENGNEFTAMIKEVQRHPISNMVYHIDFKPIELDEIVASKVPIEYVNVGSIKNKGGIVESQKRFIEVEGKAQDIPNNIKVDVSKFAVGQTLKVKDIEIAEELSINENFDKVVASLISTRSFGEIEEEIII